MGIELELKAVTASVFFSSDAGNPDTFGKSWADLQMFTVPQGSPDPQRLCRQAEGELDPVKRAAMFIRMNDLACSEYAVVPICQRPTVTALAKDLQCPLSGWAYDLSGIAHWYREA